MDYLQKIQFAANSYYNRGLEMAKERDLSGAALYLKRALQFNKYHTDARNLLGLIFYEMGETSDALTQWVISINLQPENNRADHYLDEVQRKPGQLEIASQTIKKYNQALFHAQGGSDDLAVLQLKRIVEEKPNFVKAHLLLALLYMAREDFNKAGRCLYKILQIDKSNQKALHYMSIVKQNTGRADAEKRKMVKAFSHRKMEDDDVIIPPSYRENTKDMAVINILAGLLLGAAVIFFLVMPANTRAINEKHNQEMLKYSESLSQANQKADSLSAQIAGLEEDKKTAEESLSAFTNDSDSVLAQYQNVIGILQAYKKDDFTTAVKLYADLKTELIASPDVLAIVGEVKTDMEERGYQVLESLGDEASGAGDSQTALDYYLKSLAVKPDYWAAKYKAAVIYKGMNQKEQANEMFTDIINNSKDETLTAQARTERGF